jgi:DNA processing protein
MPDTCDTPSMSETDPTERLAALVLARSTGIGPVNYRTLVRRFGTARSALAALPALVAAGRLPEVRLARAEDAERELADLAALGGHLLALDEENYPVFLREIDGAPPVLAVRGRLSCVKEPGVAIVGARNASANGMRLARDLAGELASAGIPVVSGLARGIDTAAHAGALEAGGPTVAVVACGVDIAYPEENRGLMEQIAISGAVASERPLGAAPRAKDFPRRNRIISGLSLAVVVVEAAPQSGSLITARCAADQGREVMAVPGSPLDPRHRGTNRLLKDGAHLVESCQDVLAVVEPLLARRSRRPPAPRMSRAHAPRPTAAGPVQTPIPAAPAGLAGRVASCLGPAPVLVDELIRQCHASPAAVQEALLELELEGRLEWHPGNRVARRMA